VDNRDSNSVETAVTASATGVARVAIPPVMSARVYPRAVLPSILSRWWAHLEFTRINIGLTRLFKKIEETPTFLTLHVFLGVLDRRANPSLVRPSPDVAATLGTVSQGWRARWWAHFIPVRHLSGERPRAEPR
jgi:hypothetical protein